jgi:GTP-binding protein
MFVDEANIHVKAGNGGDCCVAFRREKYVPKGGPDGGDGGDGGSIIFEADPNKNTLMDFTGQHHWRARSGAPGMGKKMAGENGRDKIIKVPPGTLIYDTDYGILLADLDEPGKRVVVAKGGRGGRGNWHFRSPTNQAPRYAEKGTEGQERNLRLELKLIADVGLVGMPNAGKSTLLNQLTNSAVEVEDKMFATLDPASRRLRFPREREVVITDTVGFIHELPRELYEAFRATLEELEDADLFLQVVDVADQSWPGQVRAVEAILQDLGLDRTPRLIVFNKSDLAAPAQVQAILKQVPDSVAIAAVSRETFLPLLVAMEQRLFPASAPEPETWQEGEGTSG